MLETERAPGTLYKYMPEPRFLSNGLFRLSQPSALNDPHEALPQILFGNYAPEDRARARQLAGIDIPEDELEMMLLDPFPSERFDERSYPGLWPYTEQRLRPEPFNTLEELDRAVAARAHALFRQQANLTMGVISLTTSKAESMWAYYADEHRGVAVTFDATHAFLRERIKRIDYSDEPISISTKGGMVRLAGYHVSIEDILNARIESIPLELFLRKKEGWHHEEEWRLVAPLRDAVASGLDTRDIRIHLMTIPSTCITCITFGLRSSDSSISDALSAIQANDAWGHLKVIRRQHSASGGIDEQRIR